jgi:hypothetical protein
MSVNAVLYSGCMSAATQLFDTMVRQQEAANDDVHNDDDNEVVDWDPDVANNNDTKMAVEHNFVDETTGDQIQQRIGLLCLTKKAHLQESEKHIIHHIGQKQNQHTFRLKCRAARPRQ